MEQRVFTQYFRTASSSKSQSPPVKRVRTPKLPHTPQGSPRKSRSGRRRSSFTKVGISADETTEEDDETTAAEMSEREGQIPHRMSATMTRPVPFCKESAAEHGPREITPAY
ncbi:hypothetical protein COOONC_25680 [Cooperia oncophora]